LLIFKVDAFNVDEAELTGEESMLEGDYEGLCGVFIQLLVVLGIFD